MRIRTILFSITASFAITAGLILSFRLQAGAAGSSQEAPLNPNGAAYEVNIDSTGQLWISDLDAGEIWGVNPGTGAYTVYQGIQALSDARRDASGMVWWGDWDEGRFGRLDPATGDATWWVAPGVIGLYGTQVDDGTGDFWVAGRDAPYLYRFDPGTSQLCTYTLPLSGTAYYPLVQNGMVWLGDANNESLLRLDLGSDNFTTWELPEFTTAEGMAFDSTGALWIADSYNGTLDRFWPGTNELDTFDLPTGFIPEMIAIEGRNVWYTELWDPAIGRLDPATATYSTTSLSPAPPTPASVTCNQVAPSQTGTVSISNGTLAWVDQAYSMSVDSGGWSVYGLPEPDVAYPWGVAIDENHVYFIDSGRQMLGRIPLPTPYDVYLPLVVR
jgi:streptogramin lyase